MLLKHCRESWCNLVSQALKAAHTIRVPPPKLRLWIFETEIMPLRNKSIKVKLFFVWKSHIVPLFVHVHVFSSKLHSGIFVTLQKCRFIVNQIWCIAKIWLVNWVNPQFIDLTNDFWDASWRIQPTLRFLAFIPYSWPNFKKKIR
jgi:hypothetical protein